MCNYATMLAARDMDTAGRTIHMYNEFASKLGVPHSSDTIEICM